MMAQPGLKLLIVAAILGTAISSWLTPAAAAEPSVLDRCEVIPLADRQTALQIDGVELIRWHFGSDAPRPYFYTFRGPSGSILTRMGHPGAENHDHHRSIWFAHERVDGVDFWSDRTEARIRQQRWLAYEDGHDEAVMVCECGWYDGQGRELMQQETVAALIPLDAGEHALELQVTLRPGNGKESVELGKTNFGLLAVRVAKSLSVHFGGGRISDSEGRIDEARIFGQTARWVDYSGPVSSGTGARRKTVIEGITYFDHPKNPRYPTHWHVREDGWMGASLCFENSHIIGQDQPLVLRYLLHAHSGAYDPEKETAVHEQFASRPGFVVSKSTRKHRQFEVRRK